MRCVSTHRRKHENTWAQVKDLFGPHESRVAFTKAGATLQQTLAVTKRTSTHGLDTEGRLQNMIAQAVGNARETCA